MQKQSVDNIFEKQNEQKNLLKRNQKSKCK